MKRPLIKKISIIVFVLILTLTITTIIVNVNKKDNNTKFITTQLNYTPTQAEITNGEVSESNYKAFSDFYIIDGSVVTPKGEITENDILMLFSDIDLYAMSYLCNIDNSAYNEYHYELYSNINYKTYSFIPISNFIGTFNGNGFEIHNLTLVQINTSNEQNYSKIIYYSMFQTNNGIIENLGLVDSDLIINSTLGNIIAVAPLCGVNLGTITNCYVKDLRNPNDDDNAGIKTFGGFLISGMVYENKGTFSNSYSAYGIVCSYYVTDYISFYEILGIDSGDCSNLFFYNSTLENIENNKAVYNSNLVGKTIDTENKANYNKATWCRTINILNGNFTNLTGWYTNSNYKNAGNFKNVFAIETPILRGLSLSYDLNEGTFEGFIINSLIDFLYMYELFNSNSLFASINAKYFISSDIDLSNVDQSKYNYDGKLSASIIGLTKDSSSNKDNINVTDAFNNNSNKYTIYNAKFNSKLVDGIYSYGFVSELTGTISNLNFYYGEDIENITKVSGSSITSIGGVAGIIDGGTISNVDIYIKNLTPSTDVGHYYFGGIVGLAKNNSTINEVTTSGTFNGNTKCDAFDSSDNQNLVGANSIGGVVGYVMPNGCVINTVLNSINIIASSYSLTTSSVKQNIGGVVGSGYTKEFFNEKISDNSSKVKSGLFNKGNIIVENTNSQVYVAGVIGKHIGLSNQVYHLFNQGNITFVDTTDRTHYISGVSNVELITTSGSLEQSSLKNDSKKVAYYATDLTNAGTFYITAKYNVKVAGVSYINTNSNNKFISKLSKIYNLEYKYVISNSTNKYKTEKLDNNQIIDISMIDNYTGCIQTPSNNISNKDDYKLEIETIYNFRKLNLINDSSETKKDGNLIYSGTLLGNSYELTDARNEGNITYMLSNNVEATNIITTGVFEENSGFENNIIYNSGNITLDNNVKITANIYFSGICYKNTNGYSDSELNKFNPLSNNYDKTKTGAINNAINNGDILVTNSDAYKSLEYTLYPIFSASFNTINGNSYALNEAPTNIVNGNINVTGGIYLNSSVVSNTYNLGDISAYNYGSDKQEINASGISVLNTTKASYILNSANNGIIKAINLSGKILNNEANKEERNQGVTSYKVNVNASGISVRNDKTETTANNGHASQVISFTINYGSVFAYSNCENITEVNQEANSKASGILAMGLCNVINTVNYGNIYGSESASGIFGIVSFEKYKDEVNNSNKVNIANSINYGNIYQLDRGRNINFDSSSMLPSYYQIVQFNDETINSMESVTIENVYLSYKNPGDTSGSFSQCETGSRKITPKFAKEEIDYSSSTKENWTGSVFSILNFANSDNAQYINIRYLISFNENIPLVSTQTGVTSTASSVTNVDTIYSSYYKIIGGNYTFSEYLNNTVQYAPLSSSNVTINGKTYTGLFNSKFPFRLAITGTGIDESIATDKLLNDYFQFVVYPKINSQLLEKIGWRTMAYDDAAKSFFTNLDNTYYFYKQYNDKYPTIGTSSNSYSTDVANALKTSNWTSNADTSILVDLVEKLVSDKNIDDIQALLTYLFSSENANSLVIDNNFRSNIVEYIIENFDNAENEIFTKDLVTYTNHYSKALADVLCGTTDSEFKDELINQINIYFTDDISNSNRKELVLSYVEYLKTNDSDSFFNSISASTKYQLLSNVIKLSDETTEEYFYSTLLDLFSTNNKNIINSEYTDNETKLMEYAGYNTISSSEDNIKTLFENILTNNDEEQISEFLDAFSNELNYYSELNSNSISYTSKSDILNQIGNSDTTVTNTLKDNRVYLWNLLRTTSTFKNYLNDILKDTVIYDLATEHNNTFQSNTSSKHNYSNLTVGTDLHYQTTDIFSYSSTITPNTVFYGPYLNSNGDLIDISANNLNFANTTSNYKPINNLQISPRVKKTTDTSYVAYVKSNGTFDTKTIFDYHLACATNNSSSGKESFVHPDIDGTFGNQAAQMCYQSVFITSEKETAESLNKSGKLTTIYRMIWYSNEFKSYEYYKNHPDNATTINVFPGTYTFDNTTITVGSNALFKLSIDEFSNTLNGTITNEGTTTNISFATNEDAFKWIEDNCVIYYAAFITSAWNKTSRTGVYLYQGPGGECNYLCPNSNYGTITSYYIDYTADDLLKIDGLLNDADKTQSDDERNIINRIFTDYLLNSDNKNKFLQIIDKALFELFTKGSNGTTYNYKFINKMITTIVESNITINGLTGTEYLNYSTTSVATTKTSLSEYLLDLYKKSLNNENKNKILFKASTNKEVFSELLEILFDTSKTEGATGSYDPSGGIGYGASMNLESLFNQASKLTGATIGTNSVKFPNDTALPFKTQSEDNFTAASNNMGFFVGGEINIYRKTSSDIYKDSLFYPTSASNCVSSLPSGEHPDADSNIKNQTINNNSTYYYSIRLQSKLDCLNNLVTIENTYVNGVKIDKLVVPRRCIWFKPSTVGTLRLVMVNPGDGVNFTLTKFNRETKGDYSSKMINQVTIIETNNSGGLTYGTNLKKIDNIDVNSEDFKGKDLVYYFTYTVTKEDIDNGYEFALSRDNSENGAYFWYLDLGADGGSQQQTAEKTYYIQNNLTDIQNSLNELISFLTPLEGNNELSKYQVIANYQEGTFTEEIIKSLAKKSNETLNNAIKKLSKENQINILTKMVSENYLMFDSIIKYYNDKNNLTDDYKKWLTAAYLSTDYKRYYEEGLRSGATVNLSESILASRLKEMQTKTKTPIEFIDENGHILINEFDNFLDYIGFTIKDGYGIFALASSEGIKNGQFIPDNFNLNNMDAYYDKTSDDTNGYWILTEEKSSSWRGGNSTDTAENGSVSEAFYKDMKQLKKSIATTIFKLDLSVDGTDFIIYSSSDLIDLTNHEITYYIPKTLQDKTFTINNIEIAANAKYSNFNISNLNGSITVTAEDTTVLDIYSIVLVPVDMSFELSDIICYNTSNETQQNVPPKGGIIESTLTFTSTSNNEFPVGMDLTPYIVLKNKDGVIIDASNYSYVVEPNISKKGTKYQATIKINISSSFPGGNNGLSVDLYGTSGNKSFTKEMNSDCEITSFVYNGDNADWTKESQNSYVWTSSIKFGSMLNYDDLIFNKYIPNYLISLEWTPTATIKTEVTKYLDEESNLFTYYVKYIVTAETGDYCYYTHILQETSPYSEPSVFKNNAVVSNVDYDNESGEVSLSYSRDDKDVSYVIRYNFNNIETLGATFNSYSVNSNYISSSGSSGGLLVDIYDEAECDDYVSYLIYNRSGNWSDGEYDREYHFPIVTITKTAATNAFINKITFLEENPVLSTTATIMNYGNAIKSGLSTDYVDDKEPSYDKMKETESSLRDIEVTTSEINYKVDATRNALNYFAVGSISNATLSDYAPTFKIEDHAEIYQYTTEIKNTGYGYGKQTKTDTEVLTTQVNTVLYLYVPFVFYDTQIALYDSETTNNYSQVIYLVKCVNGKWTTIYDLEMNIMVNSNNEEVNYDNETNSFTYNGKTYVKSEYAGKTVKDNISLNMDYIGTPLDNHFWYVSYVIFSESYLLNYQENSNLKFYHLAIIDATNTIYFDFTVKACDSYNNLGISSIYLSLTDNVYKTESNEEKFDYTKYISGFLIPSYVRKTVTSDTFDLLKANLYVLNEGEYVKATYFNSNTEYYELQYTLNSKLQVLPRGYFYFFIDLPKGYTASFKITTTNKANINSNISENGAYLPPSSIVTQRISVEITIEEGASGTYWGIDISDSNVTQIVEYKDHSQDSQESLN